MWNSPRLLTRPCLASCGIYSGLLKNTHLRRSPHPSSLQRTSEYASLLRISGALHLCIFEQPVQNDFFWRMQVHHSGLSSPAAILSTWVMVPMVLIRVVTVTRRGRGVSKAESNGIPTVPTTAPEDTTRQHEGHHNQDQQKNRPFFHFTIPFRFVCVYPPTQKTTGSARG